MRRPATAAWKCPSGGWTHSSIPLLLGTVVGLTHPFAAHAAAPESARPSATRNTGAALGAPSHDDDDDDDDDDGDTGGEDEADDARALPAGTAASAAGRPPPADRQDGFEAGGELDLVSRYVWRGKALSQRPAVQPEAWASYRSVTASAWANLLLTQEPSWRRLSASEATLSYAFKWRFMNIEPHVTHYWFLSTEETSTTTEVGVNLTGGNGRLFWRTTQDFDVEETKGAYYGTLGGGAFHRYGRWSARAALDVAAANASFNSVHWGQAVTALDLAEGAAEVRYRVSPLISAAVQGTLSTLISPELRARTTEPTLATAALVLELNH